MKTLFFAITLLFSVTGQSNEIPCPAGNAGNLLDKFTGSHESKNGEFEYSAQRREKWRTVVLGEMTLSGEKHQFNLHISPFNVLRLELLGSNKALVYSGSICGVQFGDFIEITLSALTNKDIDTAREDFISFTFDTKLDRPLAFSFSRSINDYAEGIAKVHPTTRYELISKN